MKAKLTDAQKIERIVKRHEDEGWTFYARYSGRCMFGQCCPGIVCPPYDTPKVVSAVKRAGIKAYPSHDSMGRDNIVYWTGVESDPEPVTICSSCGNHENLVPSTGLCDTCTSDAYDDACTCKGDFK